MYPMARGLWLLIAWLCVSPASAETLLVVRKTGNAVAPGWRSRWHPGPRGGRLPAWLRTAWALRR
jgi:hypothetical protein